MTAEQQQQQKEVAVVGSGIAGLASALCLAQQGCKVTLFERDDRLGGHSLTYPGEGDRPPVDLGFQVMNNTTYPYLTSLFDSLGVVTEPSDMSFAFSVDDGRVEWSSDALFAQPANARDPGFLYMLREIFRFAGATEVLDEAKKDQFDTMTLGEYLDLRGYSQRFRTDYILPTTAAIWSVPNGTMEQHPVKPLVAFMANHHLLAPLGERPRWRVVKSRSKTYVDAIAAQLESLGAKVCLGADVTSVKHASAPGGAVVVTVDARDETFDHVVLACHSDTSARMLEAPDRELVERVRYQPNRVVLHSDRSQMPRERAAWASWNVLDKSAASASDAAGTRDICVTYWLNHLQNLPASAPLLLCTLNPISEPDPESVIHETTLDHPVFDTAAVDAQRQINRAQAHADPGSRSIWFAGAWLGAGFHEDGIRSAVAVCKALTGAVPRWAVHAGAPAHPGLELVRGPSPTKSLAQRLGLQVFQAVASRGIKRGHMVLMLPDGNDLVFGRSTAAEAVEHGEPTVRMRIQNLGMLARCVAESDIGLGEAYMHRMFDVDDLPKLFDVLIVNNETLRETLNPLGLSANSGLASFAGAVMYCIGNVVEHIRHLGNDNTVTGSRRNIEAHYDAGNDMYKLFLDDTLTYSCGLHRREYGALEAAPGEELPLYEAQLAKLDSIIRKAGIQPSDHVLEIGCGWGSFAIRAASTVGCKVTGITISTEQLAEARERVRAAGLEDKVNLVIFDYRKMGVPQRAAGKEGKTAVNGGGFVYERDLAPGHFDKIVSIEMLEAVGHDHLPEYFETVDRMLKPGGRAVIQVISVKDDRYEEYCRTSDFIRRYIFPGGHLPCEASVRWASDPTDLVLDQVDDIGPDYAVTLRMWREKFVENRDAILALGYPESFFRCFEMYFAYCEAGFAQKYIHNYHLTFTKDHASKAATRAEDREAQRASLYNRTIVPAVLSIMVLIASLSLTLNPIVREVMGIVCSASLFASVMAHFLPRTNAAMDTSSRRANRYGQIVGVRLAISLAMCAIVVGLIAFHEVLYTTRIANAGSWMPRADDDSNSLLDTDAGYLNNLSGGPISAVHFCDWHSAESLCQRPANGVAVSSVEISDDHAGKLFVRSPMHFVVGCLSFASLARFLLERNLMNALHALALLVLSVLSHASSTKMSTAALGLAIVHGASELHASISACRTLLGLRGFTWNDRFYRRVWSMDISSLLVIRWVPVPVLLSPVILRAPWPVLIAICMIAVRETSVLIDTLLALKEDYENRLNAEDLLDQARDRDAIVSAMVGDSKPHAQARPQAAQAGAAPIHSCIYHGTLFHQRNKVDGVSPAKHTFSYKVWMALVNLSEVKADQAFQASRFVGVNRANVFSWHRKDHFVGPSGPQQPLDDCIRELVALRTGQSLDAEGSVLLLTNIRCFGFSFNPVSVYYCVDAARTRLDAVVLEVSNTPWLQKRMYVIPFFDDAGSEEARGDERKRTWRSKWKKDFHVSPFFDVFYNYEWILDLPGDKLGIRAISTRRNPDTDTADEAPARKDEPWTHTTGDAPTEILESEPAKAEGKSEPAKAGEEGPRTFIVTLNLKRAAADEQWRQLVHQPLMSFSIVLYIHVHAFIVMVRKGCAQKLTPKNAPGLGLGDALRHLAIFAVAGLAALWRGLTAPFVALRASSTQA